MAMKEQTQIEPLATAIQANVEALAELLKQAAQDASEALKYLHANQRNTAIGTILDLDQLLADATALHGAAIALHRRVPS